MNAERLLPYIPRLAIEWASESSDVTVRQISGSMVFVDISGFTKLSERLARRGRIGAEEITEVINATFSGLLGVAYGLGGGLLKFGGDALLLFFRNEGHQARAASAAWQMRHTLRAGGRIPTSAGGVLLRMSVGAHTGDFHFFLTGHSHRELIVTGPAATRTVQMEQSANAGEILLSPEIAETLPRRCVGKAKGPGFLLRAEPETASFEPFGPPPSGVDLGRLVPVAIREHLTAAIAEPEHRQATIAFIHFDQIDAAIATDGPEVVAARIEELIGVVQAAADEHGVCFLATDIDAGGGKIILTAGAPVATAQDEERMLRTVRAIVDARCDLPVRIGVNRGPIFAGDVGAPYRRTYTVMGDAVNLAARLMARAEPGTIVAMPAVLDRSNTVFDSHPLEPFLVKGKSEPIHAAEVGAISGVRAHARGHLPFVGRERELETLAAILERVRRGKGQLADFVGEAGIGKTRLAEQLRSMTPDLAHHQAAAEPYAVSTPYFTYRGLLRRLLSIEPLADTAQMTAVLTERIGAVRPSLLPWLPLLAVPLDVSVRATAEADAIDPRFRKARIHEMTSELLGVLLDGPTLVLFEDAYWMDEASRELTLEIAARNPDRPWLFCLTRRPNTPPFETDRGMQSTTIKLEPLNESESATLAASAFAAATRAVGVQPSGAASVGPVRAEHVGVAPVGAVGSESVAAAAGTGDALSASRLAMLAERAGGNPLFLQELVAAASSDPTMEALPESIEALVVARIDTLPPRDRMLLRYASVVGSAFSATLVAEVLTGEGMEVDAGAWERLEDFVDRESGGRYRFLHAMFRDVAYEGLPFRRRRALHRRTGEILEGRHPDDLAAYAELLSLHFWRAQVHDKAWGYSRMAGDGARGKYANVDAAEFYRRALDAARKIEAIGHEDVASVAEALGDVCEMAGNYTDAEGALEQARKLTRIDGRDRPELLLKEGVLRERTGRYTEALRWYGRGMRILRERPAGADVAARLALAAAGVKFRQGRFAECIRLCTDVIASRSEPAQMAHAYYLSHIAHVNAGDPRRAEFRDLALPIYAKTGDLLGQANALNNLGVDAYFEGRWDEAQTFYRQSMEVRERIGDTIGAAQCLNNIAELLSDQGRLAEAESMFREIVTVFRSSGYRLGAVIGSANLARVAARAGRVPEAQAILEGCLAEFREMNAEFFIIETRARLAGCAMLDGRADEALERAGGLLEEIRDTSGQAGLEATLQRIIGFAHLQRREFALTQDAFDESLLVARRANAAYEEALSHDAWATMASITGHIDGPVHAAAAKKLFERLGVVWVPPMALPRSTENA